MTSIRKRLISTVIIICMLVMTMFQFVVYAEPVKTDQFLARLNVTEDLGIKYNSKPTIKVSFEVKTLGMTRLFGNQTMQIWYDRTKVEPILQDGSSTIYTAVVGANLYPNGAGIGNYTNELAAIPTARVFDSSITGSPNVLRMGFSASSGGYGVIVICPNIGMDGFTQGFLYSDFTSLCMIRFGLVGNTTILDIESDTIRFINSSDTGWALTHTADLKDTSQIQYYYNKFANDAANSIPDPDIVGDVLPEPDITPPVLSNGSSSNITQTSADVSFTSDEAGQFAVKVVADEAIVPTNFSSPDASGAMKAGSNTFNLTGLTANTDYDVYIAAQDDESTPNIMATPYKVDLTTLKQTLEGTVSITGTTKYGETLIADISGLTNDSGNVSYSWDGAGSTKDQSTYTLVEGDIGNTITVTVSTNEQSGSKSDTTATVTKADGPSAPDAPTMKSKTHDRITLNDTDGYEYSDNDTTWQKSNIFDGLNAGTSYTFYQRIAFTPTHFESSKSIGTSIQTLDAVTFTISKTDETDPAADDGTITVTASGGTGTYEYSKDNGSNWQDSNVFNNLSANTYQVKARDKVNTTNVSGATPVTITEPGTWTVTFDHNYTGDSDTTTPVVDGNTVDLPTITRTGYDFVEWNTQADGNGLSVTEAPTITANTTYYAKWTPQDLATSVSITDDGTPQFGETLTAVTNITNNTGTLSYQWKRGGLNIESATQSTYEVVEADINQPITVEVRSDVQTGILTSEGVTPHKADQSAPAAPKMQGNTSTSITLDAVSGCEYKKGDESWQVSPKFTGLTENNSYTFYQRLAETNTHNASSSSSSASFSTLAKTVSSISITTNPDDTDYVEGETLDLTGMEVTVTYDDNSTSTKQPNEVTSSPANGTELQITDTGAVTITYGGQTTTFNITVAKRVDAEAPNVPVLINESGIRGDTITLDATSTVTQVGGTITYQWYKCDDTNKTNSQALGINDTLDITTVETGYYYCTVTHTKSDAPVNGTTVATTDTNVVEVTISKPALIGTITIDNTSPVYGDTLTASISGDNSDTNNFSYHWYRGTSAITNATNDTYTVVQEDIGNTLKVEVSADDCTGTQESSATTTVEKADAIITPQTVTTASAITYNKIVVTAQNGVEFACVEDGVALDVNTVWQTSTIFIGLTPETDYDLYARAKETTTHKASFPATVFDVTTPQAPPNALLGTVEITGNAIYGETLTASVSGTNELGTLVYQWQSDGVDINGAISNTFVITEREIGSIITVEVRDIDSGSGNRDGFIESAATAQIDKQTLPTPNAPTKQSITYNSITLSPTSGNEYRKDGGTWQDSNVFSGLTESTSYTFTQRVKGTSTTYESAESTEATISTTARPSSGGSGSSITTPTPEPETTTNNEGQTEVSVEVEMEVKGNAAIAEINRSTVNALVKEAEKAEKNGEEAVIQISLDTSKETENIDVEIPRRSFDDIADDTDASVKIKHNMVSLELDSETVETINDASTSGDVSISVETVDIDTLPEDVKEKLADVDVPVFDFTVTKGSKKVSNFGGGKVKVSIPYTPKEGQDINALVVYFLNDEGELEQVEGQYNPNTGTIDFKTNHFSKYLVGYNLVTFDDVDEMAWFNDAVTYIAAREIVKGKAEGVFAPQDIITRAEFVTLMVRQFNLTSETKDNYCDVEADKWYIDYVRIAKANDIVPEIYDDTFEPNSAITREEMMYMLYKSLDVAKQLDKINDNGDKLSEFTDNAEVSEYAKTALEYLISRDIINGNGDGTVTPTKTSTRAQVAQMLYNIMTMLNK